MKKEVTITAHCLIRNEENWIWYAINSVIDYVDKIIVFDTGSTDRTVEIVKSIRSPKIVFKQKGVVDKKSYVKLRQKQLEETDTDWFLILDGDEVWPKSAIGELIAAVNQAPKNKDLIVLRQWSLLGDVFHYSKELAETRQPGTPKNLPGFMMPRAVKNIAGLHCVGEYGYEGFADKTGVIISDWPNKRKIYLKHKFFHMTFLPRSSTRQKDREVMMRGQKTFYIRGSPFPQNFSFPEVFYSDRPEMVPSPWRRFTFFDQIKGLFYRSQNILDRLLFKP